MHACARVCVNVFVCNKYNFQGILILWLFVIFWMEKSENQHAAKAFQMSSGKEGFGVGLSPDGWQGEGTRQPSSHSHKLLFKGGGTGGAMCMQGKGRHFLPIQGERFRQPQSRVLRCKP